MSLFRCIVCNAAIKLPDEPTCAGCGRNYRSLNGIFLLVQNEAAYAAEMINNYFQFRLLKINEIEALRRDFTYNTSRKEVLTNLIDALEANNSILETLIGELARLNIPVTELLKACRPIGNISHFKDFMYLKRDWCWLPEGEGQVQIISSSLKKVIEQCIPDRDTALFLGSGLGRIVLEVMPMFGKAYATDLSFSMMHFFQQLLQHQAVSFYEINYSNTLSDDFIAEKLTASAGPLADHNGRFDNFRQLTYFVSDVTQLPFDDACLSSVFSVYFTDVIALKLILPEISRVLKPGGVFVHFGPLGYGFESMSEKLSANEVKERFLSSGFEIIYEDLVSSGHLDSGHSLQAVQLKNWVFAARKKENPGLPLGMDSIIKLTPGISYEVTGTLFSAADQSKNLKYGQPKEPVMSLVR